MSKWIMRERESPLCYKSNNIGFVYRLAWYCEEGDFLADYWKDNGLAQGKPVIVKDTSERPHQDGLF
ncbi:hypothetical protein ASG99_26415 [Bacillus sp. Soil768D1]|nr:hypothetical protein ASG99_26415 [Bacillus sp. Soil768D1]